MIVEHGRQTETEKRHSATIQRRSDGFVEIIERKTEKRRLWGPGLVHKLHVVFRGFVSCCIMHIHDLYLYPSPAFVASSLQHFLQEANGANGETSETARHGLFARINSAKARQSKRARKGESKSERDREIER